MADVAKEKQERRHLANDRRKHPRNGRRTTDPDSTWRWHRVAWLFAAYAAFLSVRALPQAIKRVFGRKVAG